MLSVITVPAAFLPLLQKERGHIVLRNALETCPSPVRNPVCHFTTDFLQSSFLDTVLVLSRLLW